MFQPYYIVGIYRNSQWYEAFKRNVFSQFDINADFLQLLFQAYCSKHSKGKGESSTNSKDDGTNAPGTSTKKESEMTEEEKKELRSHRYYCLSSRKADCLDI